MRIKLFFVFCLFVTGSFGELLSIERVAKYDEKEGIFIVQESYEVKPGDGLVIPAGLKVYFAPLAGLDVKGTLIIDGKPQEPVLLMSLRAKSGAGAPHDWAGIKVFQGGTVDIRYAAISNASVGVKSCCGDNIKLLNTSFWANGVNLQIRDKRFTVFDREPITYEPPIRYEKTPAEKTPVVSASAVPAASAAPAAPVAPATSAVPAVPAVSAVPATPAVSAVPIDYVASSQTRELKPPLNADYKAAEGKMRLPQRLKVLGPIALGCAVTGAFYMGRWAGSAKEYNDYDPKAVGVGYAAGQERLKELKGDVDLHTGLGLGFMAAGLGLGGYLVWYSITF